MTKRTTVAKWLDKHERWQIKVRKDGERKTFTCPIPGLEGKRQCHKKADAWLDDGLTDPGIKVSALYDRYIEQLKVITGKNHWRGYECFGRLYVKPCKGNKKVCAMTEQDYQDIITYIRDHATRKPLSIKYYRDIIAALKSFAKYARKCGVTKMHIEDLRIPHGAKESVKLPLVPSELGILFSSDKTSYRTQTVDAWYIHAWRFAVITGMRPGEICGLQKSDITKNVCRVRRAINIEKETTSGKNKNARRSFVIPNTGLDVLADQKKMLKKFGVISPYIFPDQYGEPFSQKAYYDSWLRYRKHNGISERTPYEMRHTFFSATKALPKELVKAMGGHSDTFDTFGTYGHELPGEAEETALLVDDVFKKLLKKDPE